VKIRDFFKNFKKSWEGVKYMNNAELNEEIIIQYINQFKGSKERDLMLTGDRYYRVDNDILNRRITKVVRGQEIEETYKANNKLAHAKYKGLVDEKINYLLGKPYTLKCENKQYVETVNRILNPKKFKYQLSGLGIEASNKDKGWLHVYIDETGQFKTLIIPSEQCIPVWVDNSHEELKAMIRVYDNVIWKNSKSERITNVEVWTPTGVQYYIKKYNSLIPCLDKNYLEGDVVSHYSKNGVWTSWGKVPFIAFKNNRVELPDIKFVKSLIDNYDLTRSETANFVEDVKNLIFILKDYGGEDINEFMRDLNENRAIKIDEDGDVTTLNPTMDVSALKEHYEQLIKDITDSGQGVNVDIDKFGNNPSGIALGFMYAKLDLKCNALEDEFSFAFENLMYFVNRYMQEMNLGSYNEEIEIVFNRNMKINEAEAIQNCNNSVGLVSDDTVLSNHPWVKDVEKEKKLKEEQDKATKTFTDKVPIPQEEKEDK
jgi:SPP1 family phage portal protein